MRHYVALAALLTFGLAAAPPASAATIAFKTNAQLIAQSSRVVRARVTAQRYVQEDDSTIHTVTTLAVLEDFTGRTPDEIEVWELGGEAGGQVLRVDGAPTFTLGEDVIVCLEDGPHGYRTVAMSYSVFHLQSGPTGITLARDMTGIKLEGGTASGMTLDGFRATAATVTGKASVLRTAALPEQEVQAAFTFLPFGPPRWAQADSNIPIKYYWNSNTASPFTGNTVTAFQTAMATWTNPPNAKIILNYAGTSAQTNPRGPFTGLTEPSVVVTFDDPNNELSSSTIALAGGIYSKTTPPDIVNGIEFSDFTRAYVIWHKTATLADNYKSDPDFTRVLSHEIGHTIGLGHTQTDGTVLNPESQLMYATCCTASTPVPPALGTDDTIGVEFIYPLVKGGNLPIITLDKDHLNYGVTMSGTTFVAQTTAQIVRMTQTGTGTISWIASSNVPWLTVSPSSGTGPTPLSLTVSSVGDIPVGTTLTGAVSIAFQGASPPSASIAVRLTTMQNGTSTNPVGSFDTPIPGTTGATGAIPVTGWAIDDTEVANVSVCRSAAAGEPTLPVEARCGNNRQIFLGYAVFIDNARTDIDALYPLMPRSTRGGWGFMVLTNMLPGQGNGSYTFSTYALDNEGHMVKINDRTITCANNSAVKPFGTIDTPGQGEVISGNSYVNFGWVLTQNPKFIPIDGSTLSVFVDGVLLGKPNYNYYRSDIATYFPGLANTDGAIGYYVLDTTTLTNGLHIIAWNAVDSGGNSDGIGSRFFSVANAFSSGSSSSSSSAVTESALAVTSAESLEATSLDTEPLTGSRGWDMSAEAKTYKADASGLTLVRGEELDRFELQLQARAGGTFTGYLRVKGSLEPLPLGSNLDATAGVFTWTPVAGFVGNYNLVFVESVGGQPVSRREVRIVIAPKGSNQVGPRVVIDTPRQQQDVPQPFVLAGWAADLGAASGSGIDAIHVWAYPLKGGAPIFVGTASLGGARPDVAAVHGDQFGTTGFGIYVQGLEPGNYDLAVFGHSSVTGQFVPATVVRLTVR